LTDELQHLGYRKKRVVFAIAAQRIAAMDEFHDHVRHPVHLTGLVYLEDVGMIQPPGRTRFVDEHPLGHAFAIVFGIGVGGNLDGNGPVDVGVVAFVNDAHGALAKDIDDVIFADLVGFLIERQTEKPLIES
jgi:hypothetical protein